MKSPIVVNVYKSEYDIYIGRKSEFGDTTWGNPFGDPKMPLHEKLERYEEYIIKTPHLYNNLDKLAGCRLGCHCKPKPCHGDILVKLFKKKYNIEEENSEWFEY